MLGCSGFFIKSEETISFLSCAGYLSKKLGHKNFLPFSIDINPYLEKTISMRRRFKK